MGPTATIKPLEIETSAKAAALLQGCALEPRTASLIASDPDLAATMPALFKVVAGVVARCQAVGGFAMGGVSVSETLLSSEMLQAVTGALANLAHYPEVSAWCRCSRGLA